MKSEIQFSWDWKESPNVTEIIKSVKEIFDNTGKFPNCYNVDTKSDSHGILLSINEYQGKEEIRKRWLYLWIEENCSKREFEEFKKDNGYL